ncbi:MAG: bifunctional diaminohydroxyphosphoribosylaminopyrimidine deaminase/5-amino-6-(5-phosphoribosylamino)uracil reductase RibD, partial [Streptomyces sp.]|uniref:bifunctional diaminohydroxyphosphoribosylaminopyrimidine deaminase/5-amino-6-(5-phosphoribosylamino)uracil reductase RibD n=1 Tax=Streptomyces sp. TaxID=1931 RepID=UPI003D6BC7EB
AEGFHRGAGSPHAEVVALKEAGDAARGATAVVTLEPCNHTGRTGPCAEALIAAGVSRVVFGQPDTNPVARGGAETLRAAGIDVEGGVLTDQARTVNPTWTFAMEHGRPFVTWKFAATLDGRGAAADGTSRWITSAEARADVHRLRARADAVLVGSGTARADDPHLAVRGVSGAVQPLRVVVDTDASVVRPGARVLDDAAPTLIAVAQDADAGELDGAAELLRLPRAADGHPGLDLNALLKALYAREIRSVLLEGGPTLAGAFVEAGAVDEVIGYLAPVLLGAGPGALGAAGIDTIAQALRLTVTEHVRLGPDLRITALPGADSRASAVSPSFPSHASPVSTAATEES